MPRKGPAPRRELMPDPVYRSVLVTQIVNKVLVRGKRTLAEKIVYDALDVVKDKSGRRAVGHPQAGDRERPPALEVKSRRVGGATYQVPVEVRPAGRPPWPSAGSSATRGSAARRRWPSASPTRSSTPPTASVRP